MNETFILENAFLKAAVRQDGAQLVSLKEKKENQSLLWEGDPAVWKESSPWLFPIIGRLKDDRFIYNGQSYSLPMHGFAKRMTFEKTFLSPEKLTLSLWDTPDTLAVFPWRFELAIEYFLEENRLSEKCIVTNRDDRDIYFSLGAHPGFICEKGDALDFGKNQSFLPYRKLRREDHLMTYDRFELPLDKGRLTLDGQLFANDALIFENPDITAVTLRRNNGKDIRFSFDAVPWFGLWTRYIPDGSVRYICLEPWHGVDDVIDADGQIEHKTGIRSLAPGKKTTFSLGIESL